MNVVLYMRYSSDKQTEQSIEGQRRVCTEFCKRKNYTIVGTYIDRATSAYKNTGKRSEFQKMIRDSESQRFAAVVVYKLDRFSRNRYDSALYKGKLRKNKVAVISATENINDTPDGVLMESLLEGMAEFYSMELAQKVNRGLNESALKCNSTGGSIPLGFKTVNKKYVIDDETAPIVREAFQRFVDGELISDICDSFNSKGYKTATGKEFNKNSFHAMLRNEKYMGIYKYKDIRIEGGIPAIISKELFDLAQKRIERRNNISSRTRSVERYSLTNKLYCGLCGEAMVGESGHGQNGTKYLYYTCKNRKHGEGCKMKPLRKDEIEKIVAEDAFKFINKETIDALADRAVAENNRYIAEETDVPYFEAKVDETNSAIDNLVHALETGVESTAIAKRLKNLEKERDDYLLLLREEQDKVIYLEREHIVWWLNRFVNGNLDDAEFVDSLINLLVLKVVVNTSPDSIQLSITLNLIDDKTCKVVEKTLKQNEKTELEEFGSDLCGDAQESLSELITLYHFTVTFIVTHCNPLSDIISITDYITENNTEKYTEISC